MSFEDVATMPLAAMEAYLARLPARIAELKLYVSEAASIPHMKKSHRNSLVKEWARMARAKAGSAIRLAPLGILKLMGIGVRRVPQDSSGQTENRGEA